MVLRLGHDVHAEEVDEIEEGDHDAGDNGLVSAANQLTEVEGKGLGIQGKTQLGEDIDGEVEAAPALSQEDVALRILSANQTDAGA